MARVGVRVRGKKPAFRSAARAEDPELRAALVALGQRVAGLRRDATLTQEAFAAKVAVDVRHVQDIEYGKSNVTMATLRAVARALGLSVSELLRGIC